VRPDGNFLERFTSKGVNTKGGAGAAQGTGEYADVTQAALLPCVVACEASPRLGADGKTKAVLTPAFEGLRGVNQYEPIHQPI
jgi:hypothetical protein